MATTQTLEQGYWRDRREVVQDTLHRLTKVRYFVVPDTRFAELTPAIGATAYDDSTYIVAHVGKHLRAADGTVVMAVAYNKGRAFS